MKILDILTSPWSIRPEKMAEIRSLYQANLHAPEIDWEVIKAQVIRLGATVPQEPYQVMNGVAVIPVSGVLTKEMSFFSYLFGGASMKQVGKALQAALDDPAVKAVLLDIDSPGGSVDGTEELAEQIYQARGQKPIIAYSDGEMASAAYWIASAADEIYISGETVMVGSIGVLATHIDQSKSDEAYGEKWTEITAGKYKRIASSHRPLTEEGAAYLQSMVDYLYSVFVDTVARNRGVDHDAALAMADGRIFFGNQALEVGLVDGIEAFSDLINSNNRTTAKEEAMDINELKSKHPDIYQAALAEGKAAGVSEGKEAGLAEGRQAGIEAERKRITEIRAAAVPGYEKTVEEAIADGKSTAGDVALKIVAAEKAVREKAHADLKEDGKEAASVPAAATVAGAVGQASQLSVEDQAKKDFAEKAEIRAEFETLDRYLAFRKAEAGRQFKILNK